MSRSPLAVPMLSHRLVPHAVAALLLTRIQKLVSQLRWTLESRFQTRLAAIVWILNLPPNRPSLLLPYGLPRVRPIMLRKILSQGLVIPLGHPLLANRQSSEHDDVTELLGVRKYEPPIPDELKGKVVPAHQYCIDFDIEDWKMFPDVLTTGEEVVVTEKIHGMCFNNGSAGYRKEHEQRQAQDYTSGQRDDAQDARSDPERAAQELPHPKSGRSNTG